MIRSLADLERANLQYECGRSHLMTAEQYDQLCTAVQAFWRREWRREEEPVNVGGTE